MLIQFNFKNFNSFRDEATLDLSAAKMTEFSERVISFGGEKILPVAVVYGANASGKSNVYAAFEYMTDYVVNSFKYGDEVKNFDEIRPHPFLFDKESPLMISFQLSYMIRQKIFSPDLCSVMRMIMSIQMMLIKRSTKTTI